MVKDHDEDHINVFELELELPNSDLTRVSKGLIGFAAKYEKLKTHFQLLIDTEGMDRWSQTFYGKRIRMLDALLDRYPLVVFHGDVGTGKTQTAECVSNSFAHDLKLDAVLFKLSTRVRGRGNVGEMSMLINAAFDVVTQTARKKKTSFLIVDEGDSLAANRNNAQSHHEDKVGVNTLIQRIDDLRRLHGRVLVLLCTNRFGSLDPAIIRRAGYTEEFPRPADSEREALFRFDCEGLSLTAETINELVALTGARETGGIGFTYSDIRTRLFPEALGRAFPCREITNDDLVEAARLVKPSPSLIEE